MRRVILASLLLLVLPYACVGELRPTEPGGTVVAEAEPSPREIADARFEAVEQLFQEGLARVLAKKTGISGEESLKIVTAAYRASNVEGIDVFRTLGFIVAESWGRKEAVSKVGARGLMQIMPATGRLIAAAQAESWQGNGSLHEIDLNVRYGVWYYRDLLETFGGDENAAMAAYNWGPKHIAYRIRSGRSLPEVYPSKVLEAEREFREAFRNENRDFIWRSYSRAERILSDRRSAGKPEDSPNSGSILGSLPPGP